MPGSIIAVEVFGMVAGTWAAAATAFAINMVASSIISKAYGAQSPDSSADQSAALGVGTRQQVPPAGNNKLPIIYGTAFTGGIVTDVSISENNQRICYVISLCEVTGSEYGAPDDISFGFIYWGGKRVVFRDGDTRVVASLYDESTGQFDNTVDGKMNIYLYKNGSFAPANSNVYATQVMQSSDLIYKWDDSKRMDNTVFAIIEMSYSVTSNLTGLQQTRFEIFNPRTLPGDCLYDYWRSERYGAALSQDQIDTASLTSLNAYSGEVVTYTTYSGASATQSRFLFDGLLDTNNTVMTNMQMLATCSDSLIKYNEITGKWGVIVQKPSYDIAMAIDDSIIVSSIQVTPIDLASSYNIIEVKFPDGTQQDTFNSVSFDLSIINPSLMYPNEPVNKQSVTLGLINNNVRAQYIANRLLESAREDLQVKFDIDFSGIQLEAGDIVSVTNANYGWIAKLFRLNQVVEKFGDDGSITAALTMSEYNPSIYDDVNVTQFTPSPNTGIGSPLTFGTLPAPVVTGIQRNSPLPSFQVSVTSPPGGIVQYAEVYYSMYENPSDSQRFLLGTTAINSGGNPYQPSSLMGYVNAVDLPKGDWYFSAKFVNAVGSSNFSPSSSVFKWRPETYQFNDRWLAIAYADNSTGTSGFSYNPRNKSYFGIRNTPTANGDTNPLDYTWYEASSNFGSANYLLFSNRSNRKFSFAVGNAGYLNLGGAFVPSETSLYDYSVWSALPDPAGDLQSFIDLDARTGQSVVIGSTGANQNDGFLSVTNNTDGSMKVNLQKFLNFGSGVYTKSFSASTLTIDIYGRVVGFTSEDEFFYTESIFTATSGQTSFSVSHTVGWILVFRNGVLLDPSEYSETTSTVVMNNACASGERVVVIYMRGVSSQDFYEPLNITIGSHASNSIVYTSAPWNSIYAGDQLSFTNSGTPTLYTVQSVNISTKTITFTTSISGVVDGDSVYRYRASGSNYAPFSRYDADVSTTAFTPSSYSLHNGFESVYVNGAQISEIDYNIEGNTMNGFPSLLTGRLTVIQYSQNNLGVPASNIANTVAYSTSGQTTYAFVSNPLSMSVYANGAQLVKGSGNDYVASSNNYILNSAFNNNSTLLNQQTFARLGAA